MKKYNKIHLIGALAVVAIYLSFSGNKQGPPEFESIKLRTNPGITMPNNVQISDTTGKLIINGIIQADGILLDTSSAPTRVWHVSPSFNHNPFQRKSPTISQALTAIDSGVIYVHDGIYTERITGKDNVAIIGDNRDRVIITGNDSNIVFLDDVEDFSLENMTIRNIGNTPDVNKTTIALYDCTQDSILKPKICFKNLSIITDIGESGAPTTLSGIKAVNSSYWLLNSWVEAHPADGISDNNACLRLDGASHPVIFYSVLKSGTPTGVYIADTDSRPYIAYCQISAPTASVRSIGTQYLKIWSNVMNSGFTNVTALIGGNIEDINFEIR